MATSADFGTAFATLARAIKIIDQHAKWLSSNSPNFLTLKDLALSNADGDYKEEQGEKLKALQDTLAGPLSQSSILDLLSPFIDDVIQVIGGQATTTTAKLVEIRDWMKANNKTVQTRTMALSTITADGGNTGNGAIYSLGLDRHGSALQGSIAEDIVFECVKGKSQGAGRNNEEFEYQGETKHKDRAKFLGSGLNTSINALYDSENVIRNPRFTAFSQTAPTPGGDVTLNATTRFGNYVVDTAASFAATADNVGRQSTQQTQATSSNAKSLKFLANGNFYQRLLIGGRRYDPEIPYLPAVFCYKPTGGDGTATLAWGNKSQAFTVSSSISDDDYAWLVADRDADLFFDNWGLGVDDPRQTLTLASAATFGLQVIEFGLYPGQLINGRWYWILGGSTPFARNDKFTTTLSQSADGINQRIICRDANIDEQAGFGFSFPSSGTPSEADQ